MEVEVHIEVQVRVQGLDVNRKAQKGTVLVSSPRSLLDLRYVHVPCFQGHQSVCLSGGAKHFQVNVVGSTVDLRRSIRTWALCTRLPLHATLFLSALSTRICLPRPLLPLHNACIASHRIASHHSTALLCMSSSHRIASRKVETSRHRQSNTEFTPSRNCAIAPSSLVAASHREHREQSRLPINTIIYLSIRPFPPQFINQDSLIAIAPPRHLQNLHSRSRHSRACFFQSHLATCTFHNSHHAVPTEAQG